MPRLGKTGTPARRGAVESMRQAWLATFGGGAESDATVSPAGRDLPSVGARVSWVELCDSSEFAGRWVALDDVRYQDGKPVDGILVDADRDLAILCGRVQSDECTSCAILHCVVGVASSRRGAVG